MIQLPSRTETELKLNLLKTNKQKETNPPECIKKNKKIKNKENLPNILP